MSAYDPKRTWSNLGLADALVTSQFATGIKCADATPCKCQPNAELSGQSFARSWLEQNLDIGSKVLSQSRAATISIYN
jgi:hypothetical protein